MSRRPSDEHSAAPVPPARAFNQVVAVGIGAVVVGLLGWTTYLAETLPRRYEARHWKLLWVGFDVALTAVLAYAAWAAWFRKRVMVVTALVAGTLLLCDAWFDVTTSFGNKDAWLTMLTAIAAEIPLAVFFFWAAHRILVQMTTSIHELSGRPGPPPRVRDAASLHAGSGLRGGAAPEGPG